MRKKRIPALTVFFCATVLLRCFYIVKVKGPIAYEDEMGYWGHAANLTGNTWSGVMDNIAWYSFGYSLFLVPLFLIFGDMLTMYRAAVILNIVFSLLSFYLAYKVIRKTEIFAEDAIMESMLAFLATSYSAGIFHSYIAWTETLLSFLVWLILYEMILFEEKPAIWKGMVLGAIAGYGYMVHNRMLAVILAVLLICVVLVWKKRIKFHQLLCMLAVMLVFMLAGSVIKDYLCSLMSNNADILETGANVEIRQTNTWADEIAKIRKIVSPEGIGRLILNTIGQIWELLSSTYFIIGFGVVFCVKNVIKSLKTDGTKISLFLFPVLALLATMSMTSISFIRESTLALKGGAMRIDTLFFGRYNDIIVPVVILMGLLMMRQAYEAGSMRYMAGVWLSYLALSFIVNGGIQYFVGVKGADSTFLNIVAVVGLHTFHWLGEFAVWKCALVTLLVSGVCWGIHSVKMPKQIQSYLSCVLILFLFVTTAFHCMRISIGGENDYVEQSAEVYDYLNENTSKGEKIYTCVASKKSAYDIQTRVVDKRVIRLDVDSISQITDSGYIVIDTEQKDEIDEEGYQVCLSTEQYMILQKVG